MTLSALRSILIISLLGLSLNSLYSFQQSALKKTRYEFTDTCISQADTLLKKRQYQEALAAYQKAYDTYEAEEFYEGMVYAMERMGYADRRSGNDNKAGKRFHLAREVAEENLMTNHLLTSKAILGEAIRIYRKTRYVDAALKIDSAYSIYVSSSSYDSALLRQLVDYKYYSYLFGNLSMDTVIRYLNERGRILESKSFDIKDNIFLLSDYSRAYFQSGDFQKAAAYALESVRLCEENLNENLSSAYSNALFNLGRSLQLQDQYSQALEVSDKLIEFTEINNPNSGFLLGYYNLRAVALNGLKKYQEAAEQFEKIIKAYERRGVSNFFYRDAIMNLGVCYQLMGDYEKAEFYLKEALAKEKATRKEFDNALSDRYKYLGQMNNSKSQYQVALDYYDSALKSNLLNTEVALLEFPSEEELLQSFDVLNIIKNKQTNMRMLYSQMEHNKNTSLLNAIINYTDKTHDYLMLNRESLEASQGKLFLSKNFKELYENGIDAAYNLYSQDINRTESFRAAFSFFAYSKSILFIEQSGELGRIQDSRLPESLSKEYYRLNTEIDLLEENFAVLIDQVVNSDSLRKVNLLLMNKRTGLSLLKNEISKSLGSVLLEESIKPTEYFDYVKEYASGDNALIEFFIGEHNIYLLGIHNDKTIFKRIAFDKELRSNTNRFLNLVSKRPNLKTYALDLKDFKKVSHALFESFLEGPLEEFGSSVQGLTLIPDEILSMVPFESLITEDNLEREFYYELDFLIKKVSVNYSLSSKEIVSLANKRQSKKGLFGIGFSENGGEGYSSLPGTEKEIEFLESNIPGDYFLGANGTREVFLEKAEQYDVLHLAVHGVADSKNGYQSRLIFNGDDGVLRTSDLYTANLSARLAVLSACESGTGGINKGEGTFSIARGFAIVGIPSIVMSLWKVTDDLSTEVMVEFYEGLMSGKSTSSALRLAKLKYLDNADNLTSHPFFWSNYVTLGEDLTLELKPARSSLGQLLFPILVILVLAVSLLLFRKRSVDTLRKSKP